MTAIIFALVLGSIAAVGRVNDSDYHDPEDFLPERDKFSAAPADLPKMGWED